MARTLTTASRSVALALAAALLLAACGGGGEDAAGDAAGADTDASASRTVTLVDNAYEPADPVIAAGDVELVNEGQAPHTFTIEGEDVDVQVGAGQTATATVDLAPGSYTLFCEFHRAQGMETTLTVE
ncbi:MAG TPA: cupredoxin domain-containing protein [Actinomycetota bacterium]|nr:cupredoxin domain-containing protein [Actinomycetota bacterium]